MVLTENYVAYSENITEVYLEIVQRQNWVCGLRQKYLVGSQLLIAQKLLDQKLRGKETQCVASGTGVIGMR